MIVLSDDGTLDTVLRCTECGEVFRYNYDLIDPNEYLEASYGDFLKWAVQDTIDSHECEVKNV